MKKILLLLFLLPVLASAAEVVDSLVIAVAESARDGHKTTGGTATITSTSAVIGKSTAPAFVVAGFSFQVNLPKDYNADSIKMRVIALNTYSLACTTVVVCEDVDNGAVFTTDTADWTTRLGTKTTAHDHWNVPGWSASGTYTTNDIQGPVEEVLARAGWAANQYVNILIYDTLSESGGRRTIKAYDNSAAVAARLVIYYMKTVADIPNGYLYDPDGASALSSPAGVLGRNKL